MRRIGKWTIAVTAGAICATASGVVNDPPNHPYQGISSRNAFGLKPVLPPAVTNEVIAPPLPKVFLVGITTILDHKLAILKLQMPLKPGEPQKEESLMLTEGQRENGVEVLSIDEDTRMVSIKNSGTAMTLSFEKDGIKSGSVSSTPTAPTTVANPAVTAANPFAFPAPGFLAQRRAFGRNIKPPEIPTPPVP